MKKLILLCLLLLAVTSCSSVRVASDYNRNVDSNNYKTSTFFKTEIDKAEVPVYKNGTEIGKYVQNTRGEIFVRIHKTNEDIRVYFDGDGFTTTKPRFIKKTYIPQKQIRHSNQNQKTFSNQINVSNNNYMQPAYNQRKKRNGFVEIADKVITLGTLYFLSRNQGYGYGHGFGYGFGYGFGGNYFGNYVGQYSYGVNHLRNYPGHGYIRWP